MSKLYYNISILLAASCIYGTANAENFYIGVGFGASQSNSISSNKEFFYKTSKGKRFTKGFTYSVGAGYQLKNNLRAELCYRGISNLKYSANIDNSNAVGSGAYKQKLQVNALMANIIYDIQLPSNYSFHPYFGVGLGYAQLNPRVASIHINNNTVYYRAKKSNNLSYAISGGLAFHLNKRFMLDIGYRFQDFGKAKNLSSIKLPNASSYNKFSPKSEFKIKTHSITAGIRYIFNGG